MQRRRQRRRCGIVNELLSAEGVAGVGHGAPDHSDVFGLRRRSTTFLVAVAMGGRRHELIAGDLRVLDEPVNGFAGAVVDEAALHVLELDGGVRRQA